MVFPLAPASTSSVTIPLILALVIVPLIGLVFYLQYAPRHVTFALTPSGLQIQGDLFYGRTIPRDRLVVEQAARADVTKSGEYQLAWRTNGTAMPGYRAGWFRLTHGGKALVFLSDASRAVAIPTREDFTLLVSPADPEAFLAQLKAGQ